MTPSVPLQNGGIRAFLERLFVPHVLCSLDIEGLERLDHYKHGGT